MLRAPSSLLSQVVVWCVAIAAWSVTCRAAGCVCGGFATTNLVDGCAQGTAVPSVSSSCTVSTPSASFSFDLSNALSTWTPSASNTSADVVVAQLSGFQISSSVVITVDLCAPSAAQQPRQKRLTVNISDNSFVATASVSLQFINSCPADSTYRSVIFHTVLAANRFNSTLGTTGGASGVLRVFGTLTYGHWLTVNGNTFSVVAVRVISGVASPTAGAIDLQLTGISLEALTFATQASSLASSSNGADWSWPQVLIQSSQMILTQVVWNTSSTSIPGWRSAASFQVIGIASTPSDLPVRGRLQILSNQIRLSLNTTTTPASLLVWSSANCTSEAPPGALSDAVVGILLDRPSGANVTLNANSVVEVNGNTMVLTNPWGAVFGLWAGTSRSVGSSTFHIRLNAKLHLFANTLTNDIRPWVSHFLFLVVLTDSFRVGDQDLLGSGTFRVEYNTLVNVDRTMVTSGGGIVLSGPQWRIGYNSYVAVRYNRLWCFPQLLSSPPLTGGTFIGLTLLPFRLNDGRVIVGSATQPLRLLGDQSLLLLNQNIVYVVATVMQPTLVMRGTIVTGASCAVKVTQNFLATFSASTDLTQAYRNVTLLYGGVQLTGRQSSWVFARNVIRDVTSPVRLLDFRPLDSVGLPAALSVCPSCQALVGCTAFGIFSEDSSSNPGSIIDSVYPWASYPAAITTSAAVQQVACAASCTADIACFAPGTIETTGAQNGNSLPLCSCRCALGFSVYRECAPPQGLNSGSITITNGTLALTVSKESLTLSETVSTTRSRSRATVTASATVTVSTSTSPSNSRTPTPTRSISKSLSLSQCYNFTSWPTIMTWPFTQKSPNYFFGNLTYDEIHTSELVVNVTLLPPARVGTNWMNFDLPNWNSPNFTFTLSGKDTLTATTSWNIVAVEEAIGMMYIRFTVPPVVSSKYEEVRYRWNLTTTNAVCPLRPYELEIELVVYAVPVLLSNETRDVTTAAMFVSALYGNGVVGALAARAPMLTGVVACWGPMAPYDNAVSMTFFRFGTPRGQFARGGVVGNLVAVGVLVLFYVLLVVVFSVITHVSSFVTALRNALEALHCKSNYVGIALCVLQPTLSAGIALVRHPIDNGDVALGAVGIAASGLFIIAMVVKVLWFPPDVVLVYDLVRPHQPTRTKLGKFLRWAFWPKYHFLPRNDLRRKIERILIAAPPSSGEKGTTEPTAPESEHSPVGGSTAAAAAAPATATRVEELEEDNDKLMGLLKMTEKEYQKSRRWQRLHLGDVLIIPPPPEHPVPLKSLQDGIVTTVEADDDQQQQPLLDIAAQPVEDLSHTDVARQVETEASYEMLFSGHGIISEHTEGIGIITEEERLHALKANRSQPLNLIELQRLQREEEIRQAKEAARQAREAKIAEIKAKIVAEQEAATAKVLQAKREEEERVMVPLQVLELMRIASSDKHDWIVAIRGWSNPRFALEPLLVACILGVLHGIADDYCLPAAILLLVTFALELGAVGALRLSMFVLPFHKAWVVVALVLGLCSTIAMMVGQQAQDNVALDVSSAFAFVLALWCFLRAAIDGASAIFHMRVTGEKVLALIARDQEILADEEVELHYVPPPLPVKEKPPAPAPVAEERAISPPPKPPTPPPIIAEEEEDEEPDWIDDPDRLYNPLGAELV